MIKKASRPKPLSLYPLKFEEVIADVLKVKPESKGQRTKSPIRKKQKGPALSK